MVLSTLFGHGTARGALGLRHRLSETNRLRLQGRLVVKLDVAIQCTTHDLVFSGGARKSRRSKNMRDVDQVCRHAGAALLDQRKVKKSRHLTNDGV